MKLSVYSLKEIIFQGEAKSINCKTMVGEITVLNKHQPFIGVITKGTLRVTDSTSKDHFFPVKAGFLQVKPKNEVRCIVE